MQSLSSFLIRTALIALPALLGACGGGGELSIVSSGQATTAPETTGPQAPTLSLTPTAIKTFRFTWTDVAGETNYRLLEDPDGTSGYSPVAILPADATQHDLEGVFLPERVNARYILQACQGATCTASAAVSVSGPLSQGVGYMKALNADSNDRFGVAVALSANGDTLAVGASGESSQGADPLDNSLDGSGAVYVFTRTNATWHLQARLKASNPDTYDRFGGSLALSADGNTLAVGATGERSRSADPLDNSGSRNGAVYVFSRSSGAWQQQAYLKAFNTGLYDQFGNSLALNANGDTLAIGAEAESSSGTDPYDRSLMASGAVYVFSRSGSAWQLQAFLKASPTDLQDFFGFRVALSASGDTLAVGAWGDSGQNDNLVFSGAAYVFTRSGGHWQQQAYLTASNPNARDRFGVSVALSANGDTLAVGAEDERSRSTDPLDNGGVSNGAVYVFSRSSGHWQQQAYLKAANTDAMDRFGTSLALSGDGDTLAVGASGESGDGTSPSDNSRSTSGAVYVFKRSGGAWQERAYVKAPNADVNDGFGASVALSADGQALAVGAGGESSAATTVNGDASDNSVPGAGAAYLF
ncbi:MAG: integrin [Hydrogenophaga sp.]|uniref:integrin n=1 Tax=Hydrogenophaga sp. TaxID=1904254 RepID=UPI0016AEFCAF|nr:integrin [Hydrogenophaga sp.]NIM43125.1 integrin [Hydrogenophaga sp.]NIN28193.1 integrin [Hydrogenophaga sp.]NIN30631.1 integrin [Hydrogenophaga sp.]NIN57328.1 integrin [Hydrogenophaga sp.]NIO51547.1 integrin [Hydrogenophaga sp.]